MITLIKSLPFNMLSGSYPRKSKEAPTTIDELLEIAKPIMKARKVHTAGNTQQRMPVITINAGE